MSFVSLTICENFTSFNFKGHHKHTKENKRKRARCHDGAQCSKIHVKKCNLWHIVHCVKINPSIWKKNKCSRQAGKDSLNWRKKFKKPFLNLDHCATTTSNSYHCKTAPFHWVPNKCSLLKILVSVHSALLGSGPLYGKDISQCITTWSSPIF